VTSRPEEQSGDTPLPSPTVPSTDSSTHSSIDPPIDPGVALPDPPHTGDAAVDAAVERLSRVATEPLEEQLAVYDAVHRTLQDRLADVEG
jgi:hypothetical protein